MGKFNDYLDSVGVGDDGAYMYPDTFHDDLRGAYDTDMQGASASIALIQAEVDALKAENLQLAAANWTLLQSVPASGTVEEPAPEEDTEPDEDEDPDTDDFFSTKEDD